jgi:phosphate transport system substrate-binding protein
MFTKMRSCLIALTLLAACTSAGQASAGSITLQGAGATFPYPLYTKWFKDYASVAPEVAFNYEAIGSGGGIKRIMAQTVDFGASDKFLTDEELNAAPAKLLHIPTVLGAVAVTYNVPGVASGLKLTPQVLSEIFLGKLTRWNDPRLARLNPGVSLPAADIIVVHRSDGSGTTSIFTDYLSSVSREWEEKVGWGTLVKWPVGVGCKGSGEVVHQIVSAPYSIGYVEIAYVKENNLSDAALKNRSGKFVRPTALSTRAAAVSGLKSMKSDFRVSLVNEPGKDAYPVVGLTWLLVYQQQKDAERGRKLVEFLTWELTKAEKMTSTLFYTPLPKKLAEMVQKEIDSITFAQ